MLFSEALLKMTYGKNGCSAFSKAWEMEHSKAYDVIEEYCGQGDY